MVNVTQCLSARFNSVEPALRHNPSDVLDAIRRKRHRGFSAKDAGECDTKQQALDSLDSAEPQQLANCAAFPPSARGTRRTDAIRNDPLRLTRLARKGFGKRRRTGDADCLDLVADGSVMNSAHQERTKCDLATRIYTDDASTELQVPAAQTSLCEPN
ncbi:hypothetical protein C8R43DRAFT_1133774 [Mycena crocata]|nr:hypothetical protein C8R43DRAFT_1133774 [Mycena crocata]